MGNLSDQPVSNPARSTNLQFAIDNFSIGDKLIIINNWLEN